MGDPNSESQSAAQPVTPQTSKRRPQKMLIAGIVVIAIGLVVVIAGFAKLLSGGVGTGIIICLLGIALVGLSFVGLPEAGPEPALGIGDRLSGIFFEPSRIFSSLRTNPGWLAPLLIIGILSAAYQAAFTQRLTAERIVNYTVDKMADTPFIPPEAVERAREQGLEQAKAPAQKVLNAVKTLVGVILATFFIAAIYLVALLAFGGKINYWQSVSVLAYAALPTAVITKVVSFVLLYLKSPDDIHPLLGQETLLQDNLGVLFEPRDHPVFFVIGTSIGILSFYKLWLIARGLHKGATKVSSSAAWGVAITLWVIGLLLVVSVTALFPSFVS